MAIHTIEYDDNGIRPDEVITVRYPADAFVSKAASLNLRVPKASTLPD